MEYRGETVSDRSVHKADTLTSRSGHESTPVPPAARPSKRTTDVHRTHRPFVYSYAVSPGAEVHSTWLEVLVDPVRLNVLLALGDRGAGTAGEIAARCHASERTVKRHLEALVTLGVTRKAPAESDGERPGRPPARFILDNAAREQARTLVALLSQPLGPS